MLSKNGTLQRLLLSEPAVCQRRSWPASRSPGPPAEPRHHPRENQDHGPTLQRRCRKAIVAIQELTLLLVRQNLAEKAMKRIEGISTCPDNCLCSRDIEITFKVRLPCKPALRGWLERRLAVIFRALFVGVAELKVALPVHFTTNWLHSAKDHHQ